MKKEFAMQEVKLKEILCKTNMNKIVNSVISINTTLLLLLLCNVPKKGRIMIYIINCFVIFFMNVTIIVNS